MDELQITATFPHIPPENLAEFKEVATRGVEVARGEEGTLRYDWFLDDSETRCVVHDAYASSDALLAHMGNMGDILSRLVELGGGMEVEVFGEPSDQLLQAAAAFEPKLYSCFASK